jgi:hypothetical protein
VAKFLPILKILHLSALIYTPNWASHFLMLNEIRHRNAVAELLVILLACGFRSIWFGLGPQFVEGASFLRWGDQLPLSITAADAGSEF